jgi:hypothetical protein
VAGHDLFAGSECERSFQGDYQAQCNKVGKKLQIPPAQIDQNDLLLDEVSSTAVYFCLQWRKLLLVAQEILFTCAKGITNCH